MSSFKKHVEILALNGLSVRAVVKIFKRHKSKKTEIWIKLESRWLHVYQAEWLMCRAGYINTYERSVYV